MERDHRNKSSSRCGLNLILFPDKLGRPDKLSAPKLKVVH